MKKKIKPYKPLTGSIKRNASRNNQGKITVRHRGGGHKKLYRRVDFRQNKIDITGKVETIEYDPYRTSFIALVVYSDGERRYILAPHGLKKGQKILTAESIPIETGMRTRLKNIPVGIQVHNVEINPGSGGKIARSAGSSVKLLALDGKYAQVKTSSGEIRKILAESMASVGQVSNPEHKLQKKGKAGKMRWLGRRPVVRGSAMNAKDHPYGGGEGKTQRGTKRPKTKWGKITGGKKTRKKKKWSNSLIVSRRKK